MFNSMPSPRCVRCEMHAKHGGALCIVLCMVDDGNIHSCLWVPSTPYIKKETVIQKRFKKISLPWLGLIVQQYLSALA
jgi:hypothetical protein